MGWWVMEQQRQDKTPDPKARVEELRRLRRELEEMKSSLMDKALEEARAWVEKQNPPPK